MGDMFLRRFLYDIKSKIRMSRLVKNYIWVFLGQNLGTFFSMLTLAFTLRVISTYEYGSLVIIQTYCLLISNLFSLRTFNGVIKFATDAEQNGEKKAVLQYINTGFCLDIIAGLISIVCGFLLLTAITALMGWDINTVKHVNMYLPVVLFYPLLNGTSTGVLRKLGYFFHVNLIHAIVFGIQFLLIFSNYVLRISSFTLVLLEYAGTEILECLALAAYSIVVMQKNIYYKSFWRAGLSKDIRFLKYNVYYGLISTFDQLLGNVSTLLINKYIGNFATAYIKVITKICGLFSRITNPIGQIFYPELCEWVAKKRYKDAIRVSMTYFYVVVGGGTVLVAGLSISFSWWIKIFDASMESAKLQSMLYMVYTLLSVSIICLNQLALALDLVKHSLILTIVFDALYIIALIPVIRNWGVYGYLVLQIIQLVCVASGKLIFVNRKANKLSISD